MGSYVQLKFPKGGLKKATSLLTSVADETGSIVGPKLKRNGEIISPNYHCWFERRGIYLRIERQSNDLCREWASLIAVDLAKTFDAKALYWESERETKLEKLLAERIRPWEYMIKRHHELRAHPDNMIAMAGVMAKKLNVTAASFIPTEEETQDLVNLGDQMLAGWKSIIAAGKPLYTYEGEV